MDTITTNKFWVALSEHSRSNSRYKALIITGLNLQHLARLRHALTETHPEISLADGLKELVTSGGSHLANSTDAKYWFQSKFSREPLSIVYRLDWLFARWSDPQFIQWLDFLAHLEPKSAIVLFSSLPVTSSKWKPFATLSEIPGLVIWKPRDSRFEV